MDFKKQTVKQVAALEQSKKLKELGIDLKTIWMWWEEKGEADVHITAPIKPKYGELYPAPTAEEITELLPSILDANNKLFLLHTHKVLNSWQIEYSTGSGIRVDLFRRVINDSLTQALASMLIWLLENNHIKAEDLR